MNDSVGLIGIHDTEGGSNLHRNGAYSNGNIGLAVNVELQHLVVIHLVDVVTGENEHILRIVLIDEADILIDCVGSTLVPLSALQTLVGGKYINATVVQVEIPRSTVADVTVQLQGAVLSQYAYGVDVRIGAVRQRKIDDSVFSTEGNGRLCHFLGQKAQTAALAAGQQHCDTFLLAHDVIPAFSMFLLFIQRFSYAIPIIQQTIKNYQM